MKKTQLIVRRRSAGAQRGIVEFGPFRWPCALGKSGIRSVKREGDGATPRGRYSLLYIYFRPDRMRPAGVRLPARPLARGMGWCDAASDGNYNRPVTYPYRSSAETLWRDDNLYDLVVVLDYNIHPRVRGKGSAIFMHVARPGIEPTEGCIALKAAHLRRLLEIVPRGTILVVE